MNVRMLVNLLGRGLLFLSLAMVPCILLSYYTRGDDLFSLVTGFLISIVSALVMLIASFGPTGELRHREGFLFVALAWTLAGFLGALPFWLSGYIPDYLDALFETVSGFTTTGATILVQIDALPRGLLLWRSLIQWLGGMGIIVLTIAILPYLRVGGMQIFKAESPGPTVDKLKPRITETAKLLWGIYVGLTCLEIILLMVGGMNGFDAVCHGFTTMATGGFSVKSAGIASYNSAYIDAVITVFMLLGGASFTLHYFSLSGNPGRYLRSQEFRWYIGLFVAGMVVIMWSTRSMYGSFAEILRYVSFQTASIMTTTGYATYDYTRWPAAAQMTLLFLMLVGGSTGSTAGGMKVMRLGILIKYARREILRLIHPHAVVTIKWDRMPVSQEVLSSVVGFSIYYVLIFAITSLILALLGVDFLTAVSAAMASISNIGPGLASVGPFASYADLPSLGKALLTFCMLVGRLEIYTVLVVLSPMFWRK